MSPVALVLISVDLDLSVLSVLGFFGFFLAGGFVGDVFSLLLAAGVAGDMTVLCGVRRRGRETRKRRETRRAVTQCHHVITQKECRTDYESYGTQNLRKDATQRPKSC